MLSVIIPVLDEAARLPGCLDALREDPLAAGIERIVVDGGSRDDSAGVARRRGARVLTAPRGRGRQMNAGARAAEGSLLVFLPADTQLPGGALAALREVDRRGEPLCGGFRQRFDRDRPALRWISRASNLRARVSGVFYGDQVPFVRRDLFWRIGGFREGIDMEDVEFGVRLRRAARPAQLPLTVTTSSRRFDAAGDLRTALTAAGLLLSWWLFRHVPYSRRFFTPVR